MASRGPHEALVAEGLCIVDGEDDGLDEVLHGVHAPLLELLEELVAGGAGLPQSSIHFKLHFPKVSI